MSDGVTGNTSDFGSEESRFEPWSDNIKAVKQLKFNGFCCFNENISLKNNKITDEGL